MKYDRVAAGGDSAPDYKVGAGKQLLEVRKGGVTKGVLNGLLRCRLMTTTRGPEAMETASD